ncbi:hypothetical protein SLA2020_386200 [Shorea laevis]
MGNPMTENSKKTRSTGRQSHSGVMKNVSPLSSKKKNTNTIEHKEGCKSIRSRIQNMGSICKSRKEAAFLQSSVEEDIDLDLDKQLGKESCFDDEECLWLSSDCTSPSSFFEEYIPSGDLIPDVEKAFQNDLKEGKVVTWLRSSTGSDAYAIDHECESSLLNLDGEDCSLISDKNVGFDSFQSDFPSPSCKSSLFSEVVSSSSSTVSSKSPNSSSSEEPLFWPLERKFDWRSEEPWNWFSISPRKEIITPSKSVGGKKMEPKDGCRRRLVFSSNVEELKQQDNNIVVPTNKINSVPSRLSKLSKNSVKIVPLEMKDEPKSVGKDRDFSKEGFGSDDKLLIEKEDFVRLDQELPIEALLGLDEFKGCEGVDSGFDGDVFSLDESFCFF